MKALTRQDLDQGACASPGCDHTAHDGLFLHGQCHMHAPLVVEYRAGVLVIACAECDQFVTAIAVKERP